MSSAPQTIAYARHDVTAVLVTHDGERWVGRVVDALAAQERPIQRIVAVDTSSRDGTIDLLNERLGPERVIGRPRDASFGQAVGFGVGAVFGGQPAPRITGHPDEPVEWIWVVHDDCEPATDALRYMLALVDDDPDVGVVGPKVLGWYNSREILEAGVTIASSGRRETGLDRGEEDQGQHDGQRAVLAVSSAGMLVRRDVWDALRGFDRNLPFMRDDVDFCWRVNQAGWRVVVNTDAVVYHAEAAAREQRRLTTRVGRAHYLDRAHSLYVLLVNLRLARVPLALVRLTLGTVARTFGYLVAKLPEYAIDEVLALGSVVGRSPKLVAARLSRRRRRRVRAGTLRALFPPRGSQLRHIIDAIAERLPHSHVGGTTSAQRPVEAGPVAEEAEDLEGNDRPIVRRIMGQPLVVLMVGLAVLTVLAGRELIGGGRLMGGALLPAPDGASDLWTVYLSSWHPVGVGSGATATPYLGALAALSTLLFGNASRAVDLLVVGAVPLCGLTAYLAARKVVASRLLRLWAAGAYALLPAVTGAVAAGRLGTTVGAILLPIAGLGVVRTLGLDGRAGTWRAAWATGLLLALITAFAPVAWLIAAALAVVAAVLHARTTVARLRLAAVLATPVIVLLPWSITLVHQPSLIFLEAGLPGPGLSDTDVSPLALLLLHPGGPGMYPVWISAGILLAGFAALLRNERRGIVTAGWAIALAGLVVGLLMSRVQVTGPTLVTAVPAWPGFATAVMGAGLLLAALIGAEGARDRIAAKSFGWQQPVSVGITLLAIVAPAVAGLWWIGSGADGPVARRNPVVLPQFVALDGQTSDRPRTLVLRRRTGGLLSYSLLRATGPRLGDAETAPRRGTYAGLDQIVTEIVTGHGQDEVDQLADYAIRYVLLTSPVDAGLTRTLDGVPGLERISVTSGSALWRLEAPAGRLRVVPPPAAADAAATAKAAPEAVKAAPVASGVVDADTQIPSGPAGRLLVLAENADSGWHATLAGRALRSTTYKGWAQAFELPAAGGYLKLTHHSGSRDRWLLVQVLAIAVVMVLALPGGRRAGELLAVDESVTLERRRRIREPQPGFPAPAYDVVGVDGSEGPYSGPVGAGYGEVVPRHEHEVYEPEPAHSAPAELAAGHPDLAHDQIRYDDQIPYEELTGGEAAYSGIESPPSGQPVPAQYAYPADEQPAFVHAEPPPQDYAVQDYAAQDYGAQDYGAQDYAEDPWGPRAGRHPAADAWPGSVPAEPTMPGGFAGPPEEAAIYGGPTDDVPEPPTATYEVIREDPYPPPSAPAEVAYGYDPDAGEYPPVAGYGYDGRASSFLEPAVGPYEGPGGGDMYDGAQPPWQAEDGAHDQPPAYPGQPSYPEPSPYQPQSDHDPYEAYFAAAAHPPYAEPGGSQNPAYEPDTGHVEQVRRGGRHARRPAEQAEDGQLTGRDHDGFPPDQPRDRWSDS